MVASQKALSIPPRQSFFYSNFMNMNIPLLEVKNLCISFPTPEGWIQVVDHLNFSVDKGQCLGIVGESGCGKSVALSSLLGLTEWSKGRIDSGEILFDGKDLNQIKSSEWRSIRGAKIAMIFQDPMTALNPLKTCGDQVLESLAQSLGLKSNSHDAEKEVVDLFAELGMSEPEKRFRQYPHELSGGLRQRIVIAMALIGKPQLILCDEPTTALDVTIQAQIIDLLKELQQKRNLTMIFVSHNMGVIKKIAQNVLVMYAGRGAEFASVQELFENPSHPYTQNLLKSIPNPFETPRERLATIPGKVPAPQDFTQGCRFFERCSKAQKECENRKPNWQFKNEFHRVDCIHEEV